MQPIRLIQFMLLILSLLKAIGLIAGTEAQLGRQVYNVPKNAEVVLTRYVESYEMTTNLLSGDLHAADGNVASMKSGVAIQSTILPPAKHTSSAEVATVEYADTGQFVGVAEAVAGSGRFELK